MAAPGPLADLNPVAIVSSDLRRAHDTAKPLAEILGLPITVDQRWREAAKGRWEGLTHEQVVRRFPDEVAAWHRGDDIARGGGERVTDVTQRATAAAADAVAGKPAGSVVVACTHQGLIRFLVAALLCLPDWRVLGGLDNATVTVLEHHQPSSWRLLAYNVAPCTAGGLETPR